MSVALSKTILFHGRSVVLVCDGRCDKAWGLNNRPRLYFQERGRPPRALGPEEEPKDPDDYVFIGDSVLGTAPGDPGTYECDQAKPSATPITDSSRMNKWCVRECERLALLEPGEERIAPNMDPPRPNIPKGLR